MTVLITLTAAGAGTGPLFNLFSNTSNPPYSVPFATGITKTQLTNGYTSNVVPDTTTIVRVRSMNAICPNHVDIPLSDLPTTTTTTTPTPTTSTTTTVVTYTIGQSALGGKIAYILQPGDPGYNANVQHGLVATLNDQGYASWGCYGTTLPGADGTVIGTGNQNTIDIIAGCSDNGIAAKICGNLNEGGYSDWYLPSKDELNKLYIYRGLIGGFSTNGYWSSSEVASLSAWLQDFNTGTQVNGFKNQTGGWIRAIRSF